ncbi:hypothetical protein ACROYT_G031138 [Oculina patagonica]
MVLLVKKAFSANRIFTFGLVNEYPEEYYAMSFVVNNTDRLKNASVVLKKFSVSELRNPYKQASALLD